MLEAEIKIAAIAWHPIHEGLFVSGGGDGTLAYWMVDQEKEVRSVPRGRLP